MLNIFKLTFSELIYKLDISTHRGFVPLLASIYSVYGEAVALAWGLLHAPTLILSPGGLYMHWPMYCHSWAWPG